MNPDPPVIRILSFPTRFMLFKGDHPDRWNAEVTRGCPSEVPPELSGHDFFPSLLELLLLFREG
jgi:hypothetical protein